MSLQTPAFPRAPPAWDPALARRSASLARAAVCGGDRCEAHSKGSLWHHDQHRFWVLRGWQARSGGQKGMRAGRASSARHRLARPTPIRNGPQVVPVPGMPTCILLRTAERAVMLAVDSIAHRVPCVCTGGLEYQPGEMVWAKVAPRRSPMTIVQGHRRRCLCSPRRRRTSTGSVAFATVATVAAVAATPQPAALSAVAVAAMPLRPPQRTGTIACDSVSLF